MTSVNKVERKEQMGLVDIIIYQIITYCYFEKIVISDADAFCLAQLALSGKIDQADFCKKLSVFNVFASDQVVRNIIRKCEKKNLVVKGGKTIKHVYIHPSLQIQTTGTILLDYKFLHREST